jgi:hypothetical protein
MADFYPLLKRPEKGPMGTHRCRILERSIRS